MHKIRWFIFFIFLFLISSIVIRSQPLSTKSKKAIQYYDLATRSMDGYDFQGAVDLLQEAVKIDTAFTEAWLLMADAYDLMAKYDKSAEACEKALQVGAEKYPITYYFSAQAYLRIGKYEKALAMANQFLAKNKYTPNQKKETEKIIQNANFARETIKNPVPFVINNLGDSINSSFDEYWPNLSADEEMLVFTRLVPKNSQRSDFIGNNQEDIYYTHIREGKWQLAKPISSNINTLQNEGSESITADGKQMYFTACNRQDGKGKCDIYVSEWSTEGWSIPKNLGSPINTGSSEKQPSISADGRTIYFVSDRPGGKGKFDIYVSHKIDDTNWSTPVNLGDSINTPDDEQSPYIHPDGQTLYFSTNGWIGFGGYDVFRSTKKDSPDTSWSTPINLGYPINTSADEIGLIVNARGNRAFFSSNRTPEKGKDIFEFELYKEAQPISVSYIKGKVYDAETKQPLSAEFELINLKTKQTVYKSKADLQGEFLVCLPVQQNYALNASHDKYLFYSENFSLADTTAPILPVHKNIPMQPIKTGNVLVMKNIFFETNSFKLKNESFVELDKLVTFLKNHPTIKIEVSGHTDNVGNEQFNLILSENRAKAVVEYLLSQNISKERIRYKGYGKSKPIAENDTEAGRAINRRTEIKIIE